MAAAWQIPHGAAHPVPILIVTALIRYRKRGEEMSKRESPCFEYDPADKRISNGKFVSGLVLFVSLFVILMTM